ncbi:hypothetical protein MRX96_053499 [Rhipicephalus microplus]
MLLGFGLYICAPHATVCFLLFFPFPLFLDHSSISTRGISIGVVHLHADLSDVPTAGPTLTRVVLTDAEVIKFVTRDLVECRTVLRGVSLLKAFAAALSSSSGAAPSPPVLPRTVAF